MDAGIDLRLFSSPGRRANLGLDGLIGNSDDPKPLILNKAYGRTPGTEVFVGPQMRPGAEEIAGHYWLVLPP